MKGIFENLINTDIPIIIDWYSNSCGPCRLQSIILDDVKKSMGDKVKIYKLDTALWLKNEMYYLSL